MTYDARQLAWWVAIAVFSLLFFPAPAHAFPPYRSTDADTAGAGVIEMRLGLLRVQRRDSSSEHSTPLTRTNFGIGQHFELVTELEHSAERHELAEGALGFKWAQRGEAFGVAVETLALLPVNGGQSGTGIESQFITTFARERWQLHVNAGGVYDPRAASTERAWRASLLAEFPRGDLRPGVELFAKKVRGQGARVQAGVGTIAQLRRVQIRTGLHFGLTDEAPDVEGSVWLAWAWDTRSRR